MVRKKCIKCDEVETAKEFCYLGDRLNGIQGCKAAVNATIRSGLKKFREYGKILLRKIFLCR